MAELKQMQTTVTYSTRNVLDGRKRQHGAVDVKTEPVTHPMYAALDAMLAFHDHIAFDPSTDRFEGVMVRDIDGSAFYYTRDELVEIDGDVNMGQVRWQIRERLLFSARQEDVAATKLKSWF